MSGHFFVGDRSCLRIPADPAGLAEAGPEFLTTAFHAAGVLAPDNSVARIDLLQEVCGGSTGRKALLDISYAQPQDGLPRRLFVKFSRDFDEPTRDHGRTQMAAEVDFAELARQPDFPIKVPATQFADYQRDSGSGVLISERIEYGANGIEPHREKCLDYEMSSFVDHYRAIVSALGRLAGTHRSGRLPEHLTARFPVDLQNATVGDPPPITPERLHRRLDRLAEFAELAPALLPASVRAPAFLTRLRQQAAQVLTLQTMIWQDLEVTADHIALCHWNANVDNAWFWTDGEQLRCGLMDWGCVSQMNVAMALWGALSAAENELWADHFDDLVDVFATEYRDAGGPEIDRAALVRQVLVYAALMGITWLLDVPALVRATVPDADRTTDRHHPAIKGDERVRAPLQMLTNVLSLWETHDVDAALAALRQT
ncbi:hypothetical protein [Mycolicibacterium poriferae]|mgnify:FL=1|uniref:hypothetical protein n=1 Tax=Mycolicibacterium poriferae TaxID=39694 RepID=UPI0024BAAFBE|nr:hypothetical protein [Mycolicibacterium poriferae]